MNRYDKTIEMYKNGYEVAKISEMLKQSKSTTYRYLNIYTGEELESFIKRGFGVRQIACIYGVVPTTINNWCRRERIATPTQWREKQEGGFNADRHLCKKCQYRMHDNNLKLNGAHCAYICVTGESRKCDAAIYDKYIQGKPKREKAKFRV